MPMGDTLEIRIAHLEGAYEQVDKRLGAVESILSRLSSEINQLRTELTARIDSVNERMDRRIDALTGRMDGQFHWLIGITFTSWITLLLAILFRH